MSPTGTMPKMSKPTIEEILTPKPEARPPRIYVYSIADAAHEGLLKIGQTIRDVKLRIAEQVKTAAIKNYRIELDESAERDDGTIFSDHEVRAVLVKKKIREPRTGMGAVLPQGREDRAHRAAHGAAVHRHASPEVFNAPRATGCGEENARLLSFHLEGGHVCGPALPLECQNAFRQDLHHIPASKEVGAKRVRVVTFKPAVEDAWQSDIENHVDFDGWQYLSRSSGSDPTKRTSLVAMRSEISNRRTNGCTR